ncbi:hypothetical protein [Streptomyces ochraceiscleroticus]|uniref:Transferase n=1 Tax=Streptomyces ochraceiscleroticus TaxID=47761 RepID=A0ABW1MQE8_9ACTN|nr:hypothetical protein [Streptomyces ochraceiscleroticus]
MSASMQLPATGAGTRQPARTALHADCIADSAGGLTFDIAVPDPAGEETGTVWSAALVLRLRGGEAPADEIRLPLGPNGAGRLRAVLPSTVALPEGRWNVYADLGNAGDPQRLLPGVNDLRSLVDRRPLAAIGRLGVRIPYATKYGNLALRSWLRGPHAESGEITVAPDGITVQGRLYGAALEPGAAAEARARQDGHTVTIPLHGDGPDFAFVLPHGPLAEQWRAGTERWDLWVRTGEVAEPVRISRILDDVPDKKQIFTYPAMPIAAPGAQVRVGPYFTVDNDLSVKVVGPQEPS